MQEGCSGALDHVILFFCFVVYVLYVVLLFLGVCYAVLLFLGVVCYSSVW